MSARSEIIEVAFPYQATYRMPRKRNHDSGWFRASMPLSIDCLTSEEAPVVCRVRSDRTVADEEDRFDYSIRHHGDAFWRPSQGRREAEIDFDRLKVLAAADPGAEGWSGNPFGEMASPIAFRDYQRRAGWLNALPRLETVLAKEIVLSGRDEAESLLRTGIEDYRIIAGVLHHRCEEPRLTVSHGGHRFSLAVETSTDYRDDMRAVFRVDRVAEARSFLASLLREHRDRYGRSYRVLDFVPRVEAFDTSTLRRDDLLEAAKIRAPKILAAAREFAAWLPRPEMEHFLDMREAEAKLAGDDAVRADAVSFLEAYARLSWWSETLADDEVLRTPGMPYSATSFGRDHSRLLTIWRVYEGGRPAPLAEADGSALAALGDGPR
jgi:hypothetical protein